MDSGGRSFIRINCNFHSDAHVLGHKFGILCKFLSLVLLPKVELLHQDCWEPLKDNWEAVQCRWLEWQFETIDFKWWKTLKVWGNSLQSKMRWRQVRSKSLNRLNDTVWPDWEMRSVWTNYQHVPIYFAIDEYACTFILIWIIVGKFLLVFAVNFTLIYVLIAFARLLKLVLNLHKLDLILHFYEINTSYPLINNIYHTMKPTLPILLLAVLYCTRSAHVVDLYGVFNNFTCLVQQGYSHSIIRAYHSYGAIDLDAPLLIQQSNKAGLSTDVYMFPCRGKNATFQVN